MRVFGVFGWARDAGGVPRRERRRDARERRSMVDIDRVDTEWLYRIARSMTIGAVSTRREGRSDCR